MERLLVIDIGGTKTNIAVVGNKNSTLNILSSSTIPTEQNPSQEIYKIESVVKSFNTNITSLSLSLPGMWDKKGVLKESYFLQDYLGYPFIDSLVKQLQVKEIIWAPDVICGALGEYHYGLGANTYNSLLYINLGTGISASLIKDGKPYTTDSGLTLRMQKLVLPFQEELYSGVDLISGGSLLQISKCTSIKNLYSDYKNANIEALDIILKAQTQLAAWLINLYYLFSPKVIVLNGGLTYDWEVLAEEAIDIANEELENQVQILPSKLQEKAPLYGAYVNWSLGYENFSRICHSRKSGNPDKKTYKSGFSSQAGE